MGFWNRLKAGASIARMLLRLPPAHCWFMLGQLRDSKKKWHNGRLRINSFLPPYPSRAFTRWCDHALHRRRVPLSAYMAVTSRCPCRCSHCSYAHRGYDDVSPERLADAVRQVRELGACMIGFTGGEPLLRSDLAKLIASVSDDTATLLFTTGHRLDVERAKELADAGLTTAVLSIESTDPDEHDAIRGHRGSFAGVQRAIEACHQAGIFTSFSTIAFADRIESGELDRIYELATAWGVGEMRVPNPVATGGIAGCSGSMLDQQQMEYLRRIHKKYNDRKRDGGPTMASIAYMESDDLFGCGAAYHHMFVDDAGEVCPCDLTPLSFGNLHERPLAEIWEEMGEYFPRPRCGCLMNEIGERIPCNAQLPLLPSQSRSLVSAPGDDMPLPRAYQGLLTIPSKGTTCPQGKEGVCQTPAGSDDGPKDTPHCPVTYQATTSNSDSLPLQ